MSINTQQHHTPALQGSPVPLSFPGEKVNLGIGKKRCPLPSERDSAVGTGGEATRQGECPGGPGDRAALLGPFLCLPGAREGLRPTRPLKQDAVRMRRRLSPVWAASGKNKAGAQKRPRSRFSGAGRQGVSEDVEGGSAAILQLLGSRAIPLVHGS